MAADPLLDGECRVWWARPDQAPDDLLLAVVPEAEQRRAARYRQRLDRLRSLTGAWLLRTAVAALTGERPSDVLVDRTCADCGQQHGRPRLPAAVGIEVSVSHAGERVAVALTRLGEVGIDVEFAPLANHFDHELAENALSPQELSIVDRSDNPGMDFRQLWVRKEALLKATGHGLRIPMSRIEVSPATDPPALLAWPLDIPVDQVRLATLDPGPRHHAAVAVLTGQPMVVHELDAELLLWPEPD
ncbi:4'-phosphopantetheinyl transferase family protein [Kutzneria sp. CA-103260]|uniref:4'-phosphopantetheinyl transferase family protein n=1 Tax=Kutzneria sp. CA-103260 TaxID=2802641 RepID=UPI001BAD19EA|nr:4'-phosphopantetheinyl transferase superfamily protein [Kutzneria sp. CA-103260]